MIDRTRASEEMAAGALRHVLRLTGPGGVQLDPIAASLTLDETWAPYATLEAQLRVTDAAALDLLDPRTNPRPRITIAAGYVYADGTAETETIAVLPVHAAPLRVPELTASIVCAGEEDSLGELVWLGPGPAPIPQSSVSAAIQWCLNQLPVPPVLRIETDAAAVTLPDLGVLPGTNLWELASGIANDAGRWLRYDGLGWILGTRDIHPGTAAALTTGPVGTIIAYTDQRTRDRWADAVLTRAMWRDDAGQDHTVIASAKAVTRPSRVHVIEQTTPTTYENARRRAETTLNRLYARGRGYAPLTAKAAYWLRPGDSITISTARPQERHRVKTARFEWPAGRMTITTAMPNEGV